MTLEHFIELANNWQALGADVQEALLEVLDDINSVDDQDPKALAKGVKFLDSLRSDDPELNQDAQQWAEEIDANEEDEATDDKA